MKINLSIVTLFVLQLSCIPPKTEYDNVRMLGYNKLTNTTLYVPPEATCEIKIPGKWKPTQYAQGLQYFIQDDSTQISVGVEWIFKHPIYLDSMSETTFAKSYFNWLRTQITNESTLFSRVIEENSNENYFIWNDQNGNKEVTFIDFIITGKIYHISTLNSNINRTGNAIKILKSIYEKNKIKLTF